MTNSITNPADLDRLLRKAHARGSLFAVDPEPDHGTDQATAAPEPPRPGPLPGGAAQSSLGMAPPDGDKWFRALVDSAKYGTPMPPAHYLTRD